MIEPKVKVLGRDAPRDNPAEIDAMFASLPDAELLRTLFAECCEMERGAKCYNPASRTLHYVHLWPGIPGDWLVAPIPALVLCRCVQGVTAQQSDEIVANHERKRMFFPFAVTNVVGNDIYVDVQGCDVSWEWRRHSLN